MSPANIATPFTTTGPAAPPVPIVTSAPPTITTAPVTYPTLTSRLYVASALPNIHARASSSYLAPLSDPLERNTASNFSHSSFVGPRQLSPLNVPPFIIHCIMSMPVAASESKLSLKSSNTKSTRCAPTVHDIT